MGKKYQPVGFIPQFGAPILPPRNERKKKRGTRRGSWHKPSRTMINNELSKCKITRIDLATGEILNVIEPTSHARPKLYGKSGREPNWKKPQ